MLLQLGATSTARAGATPWLQVSPTWPGWRGEGGRERGWSCEAHPQCSVSVPQSTPSAGGGGSSCLHKTLSMAATASCLCSASTALH